MELLKSEQPLEFKYEDVTFFIKRRATALDKTMIVMSGELENGRAKMRLGDCYRLLAERFVVGWKGVTADGQQVPYSWGTFCDSFPSNPKDDVFLKLGAFIVERTDVFKSDLEAKNDSREQLSGSAK